MKGGLSLLFFFINYSKTVSAERIKENQSWNWVEQKVYEIEHDPNRHTEGCLLSMRRFHVAFENQIINT